MFERFSRAARNAVEDARLEAARRGDRRIGTESLLVALLRDPTMAQMVGVEAATLRAAADELDRAALASVGLESGTFRPAAAVPLGRHAPLTPGAKHVIAHTLANATAERARSLTPRHMLLALLDRREPDPAATLLAAVEVDAGAVRQRLAMLP